MRLEHNVFNRTDRIDEMLLQYRVALAETDLEVQEDLEAEFAQLTEGKLIWVELASRLAAEKAVR